MPGPLLPPLTSRRLLGGAMLGLLLAGLFAMHGLASHGMTQHSAMAPASVTADDAAEHTAPTLMGGEHGIEQAAASLRGSEATTQATGPVAPGSGPGLAATCLAILAAILAAIVAALLGRVPRRYLVLPPSARRSIVVLGRDRDPPSLLRLSVMRC